MVLMQSIRDPQKNEYDDMFREVITSELCSQLKPVVSEEAMMLARSVLEENGWRAWNKLLYRSIAKTLARG